MNRYHRPVLSVGSSDKKIFLKTASKKKKFFKLFVTVGVLMLAGYYTGEGFGLIEKKPSLVLKVETFSDKQIKNVQAGVSWCYQSIKKYQIDKREKKQAQVESMLAQFSQDETLSKVVMGQSWVGQTLLEKHALNDFVTLKLKKFYQVNRNAYILSETQKEKLGKYPILSGPWSSKESHQLSIEDRKILQQGVELMALFNKYENIKQLISEVNYNQDYGWTLFSQSPSTHITLGKNDFKLKIKRLLKVMDQYKQDIKQVKSIDLDYGQLAIIKLRNNQHLYQGSKSVKRSEKGDQHGQS